MNQIKGWKTDAFPKSDTHREKTGSLEETLYQDSMSCCFLFLNQGFSLRNRTRQELYENIFFYLQQGEVKLSWIPLQ